MCARDGGGGESEPRKIDEKSTRPKLALERIFSIFMNYVIM